MKEHNNLSYLWKFEPDIPNSFAEILFEKLESLQRMYELISVFTTQQFRSFWSLKIAKTTQIKLFQFLNLICVILYTVTSSMC